jgi:DNA-binding MarR family transcriptional regulator
MGSNSRVDVRLANEAWEALMTAHATLMRRYAADDVWCDVTVSEYDVLYTIAKGDGPMRISEIQKGVLLSQPALSRAVDRLVTRGLLSRCPDARDGRAVQVTLTEDGLRTQQKVGRAHARSVARDVGGSLTDAEMQELRRLCKKLLGQ